MNSKKHISVILQDLKGGGAEKMMVNLCNYFYSRGYKVDLVLVRKEGPWLKKIESGVNIITLNCHKVLFSLIPLIHYFRKHKPDAVLSTLPHVNLVTILAKRLAGISTRLVIREGGNIELNKIFSPYWTIRISYRFIPFLYKYADKVVAASEGLAGQIRKQVPEKKNAIYVIYNPVLDSSIDIQLQQPIPSGFYLMSQEKRPIIISVGRLVHQKDFKTLIRAFNLVKQHVDALLIILGEGYLRKQMEDLSIELGVNKEIIMPGFIDNPCSIMNLADVFVMSSQSEGFGNVIVEALYCGLPVVATDCPSGPAEILKDHPFSSLVDVGDEVAMSQEIIKCLNSGISKSAIIEKRYLLNKYRINTVGDQYLRLFFDN